MFKQTKTTLKELSAQYRSVLKKCAYLNAIAVAGITFGANADYIGGKYINEDTIFDNEIVDNQEFTVADNAIARTGIEKPNEAFGGYAFVNRPSLLTVVNSSFSNISFDGYGAVLSTRVPFEEDVAKIIVRDSTFSSNHAIEDGGAIANYGHLTISGSKFEKNTSFLKGENYDQQVIVGVDVPDDGVMGGGAIALGSQSVTLATSISSSQFNENKSGLNGGAIATRTFADGNNSEAKLDIINSIFDGNIAATNGGAIDNYFYHSATNADGVTVADSTFISNKATGYGGAIYNHIGKDTEVLVDGEKQVGSMYITNSVFGALDNSGNPIADKGNTASLGGAIYNEGKMVIKDSAFYANSSVNAGGAINTTGDLTINQTDFIGNKAGAIGSAKNGGAIYATSAVNNLNISNSTFKSNATFGSAGGAIHSSVKNLTITDSIFEQNSNKNPSTNAVNDGSAIYVNGGDKFVLSGSKFNENTGKTTVYSKAVVTDVKNTEFTNNNNTSNGALSAVASSDNSLVTIDNTTFTGNTSTGSGGAAFYTNMAKTGNKAVIQNSTFTDNELTADKGNGGAISMGSKNSNLDLINNVFTGNKALAGASTSITNGQGGAVKASGTVTIDQNTFLQNEATYGGALYASGTVTVTNSSFDGNKAKIRTTVEPGKSGLGGAITQEGNTLNVSDTTFNNNEAETSGGAIFQYLVEGGTANLTLDESIFADNTASAGGALFLLEQADITKSNFIGNTSMGTTNGDAGGSIFLGSKSQTTITDGLFASNISASEGGAIATRNFAQGDNHAAKLDIVNSIFDGNMAATNGGAIDNYFYHSNTNEDGVTIDSSTFIANQAANGGAIYNHYAGGDDQKGKLYLTNTIFEGNTATTKGGAIYNEGMLNLAGTNTFYGNMADGVLNDIHNDGILNISGDLTLGGGITGNGIIKFTDTTNLVARLQNMPTINATSVTGVDKVTIAGLVAENGLSTKEYTLIDGADAVFTNIADSAKENALYKFAIGTEKGSILVTRKSVAEQTANLEKAGLDSNAAKTIAAISAVKTTGNVAADALFADLTAAAQSGDTAAAEAINEVAKTINPESEAVVQSAAVSTQNTINTLTAGRMDLGRNGGDLNLTSGGVWVQGLFNRAKSGDKFSANTRGISAGIDGTINNDIMLGIGYAYGHSDVSAKTRDTDIDNHSVFLYGQYKPTQWYANATLNYTTSGYKENGSVAGLLAVDSEYRANAFGANVATGYELPFGLTPELGLRYLHVRTNDYTNSLGFHTDAKNTNFLTGILGARYGFDIAASEALLVRPELSAAAKYDLVSDGNTTTVALPGVDAYTLDVERLKRFGGEFGAGLTMSYYGFDLSLNYYIDVREDYTSQTGMAKFRYNF